jgi:RNA polymerase sigma-54 factor
VSGVATRHARNNSSNDDDEKAQATELARNQESLTAFLHRQALALALGRHRPCRLCGS